MVTYRFDILIGDKLNRHVWHENKEVVKTFIMQHGFPEQSIYHIYPTENPILNDGYRLKEVKLKRNSDDETITIYTTRDILHDILTTLVEQLSVVIDEIPYIITHTSHDIMRVLNDLIYALPYVFLSHYVQYEGMDEIPQESLVHDMQYTKIFSSDAKENAYAVAPTEEYISYVDYEAFLAYAFDALEQTCDDCIYDEEPLPITIESYISCFIKYYSD